MAMTSIDRVLSIRVSYVELAQCFLGAFKKQPLLLMSLLIVIFSVMATDSSNPDNFVA